MPDIMSRLGLAMIVLWMTSAANHAQALDPRFEIPPEKLQEKQPLQQSAKPFPVKKIREAKAEGESVYKIKAGDNLLKILVRRYGMNSEAAEALIPVIKIRNGIRNGARLKAGDTLIIPLKVKPARRLTHTILKGKEFQSRAPAGNIDDHGITLNMHPQGTSEVGLGNVKRVWGRFFPTGNRPDETFTIKSNSFSLELDPVKFPMLPAANGGKILIESGGKLSPLVKTLIRNYDPGIRFVSFNSASIKSFYSELFDSAGFYSVEDNFGVDFGTDPKLTVFADFKVEKTADSSLQQDIALVNVDPRWSKLPDPLTDFLGRHGLKMIEYDSDNPSEYAPHEGRVMVFQPGTPADTARSILMSLNVESERDRKIKLLSLASDGVSLMVNAEQYFEKNGDKYVVSTLRGDPEGYTLLRILETMNYKVIILEPGEGFKSIAGKLLSRLRLPGSFEMQPLIAARNLPYRVQMSGIMLNLPGNRGEKLFLTDHQPDVLTRQLLDRQGYTVIDDR